MTLFEDLKWRGLIKDISSPESEKKLNEDNKVAFTILREKKSISKIEYYVYYGKNRIYRRLLRCIFIYPKLLLRKILEL